MKRIILIASLFVCCSSRVSLAQTTHWWNNSVFYEMFVRSFYDSNADGIGDFNGITQKLGYLDSLGINAIWVMPINPSPSYHGYDVTNYYGVNPQYGTKQSFETFLNAAHAKGIKVIIDWVMNHSSSQHPWFQKSAANSDTSYRSFYRWSNTLPAYPPNNSGPWGEGVWHQYNHNDYYYGVFDQSMPDLNYSNPHVKDSIFNAAAYWLDSMHVDGFRLDAAIYIFEKPDSLVNVSLNYPFWHDFNTMYKSHNPNAMTVGEAWYNGLVPTEYVTNDRLDFCFEFNQAGTILSAVNNGSMSSLKSEINSVYTTYPFLQYGSFLTNHDQNRSWDQLGQNIYKSKGAAAIYLTIPGIPFVYYGEEIGMTGSGADQNKRSPMEWNSGIEGGFTTVSPWESLNSNFKTVNVTVQETDPNSLLNWYKKLIAIRRSQPVLQTGTYAEVSSNDNILAFMRSDSAKTKTLLVLINPTGSNFSNQTFDITGSGFSNSYLQLHNLIDSSNTYSAMQGNSITGITVPAYSAGIYEMSISNGVDGVKTNSSFTIYPNPAADELFISMNNANTQLPADVKIIDATGRVLKNLISNGGNSFAVNIHDLASGFYILQLSNNAIISEQKFVKE